MAAHPADGPAGHELYLMCDDLPATVEELRAKGVEFTTGITDARWGSMATLKLPGGAELVVYEPRHPSPLAGGD